MEAALVAAFISICIMNWQNPVSYNGIKLRAKWPQTVNVIIDNIRLRYYHYYRADTSAVAS